MTHLVFPPNSEYEGHAAALEALIAADRREMEFRTYFTVNPWILSLMFGYGEGAVFSEYELAPGQRPDHLLLWGRSNSAHVTLVELKRPSARLLNAKGLMTEALNNAVTSKIVIGTRGRESEEERRFRVSFHYPGAYIEIVPFDRILDCLHHPPYMGLTGKVGPRTRVLAAAVHDEELSYRTWEGTEGRFRARTFAGPGGIVALLTDIPDGEDGKTMPYLTYNVERAAQCVCERFGLDGRAITVVEHYDNVERLTRGFGLSGEPETFHQVTFEVLPSRPGEVFGKPKWVEVTKSDVERLVGGGLP